MPSKELKQRTYPYLEWLQSMEEKGLVHIAWFNLTRKEYGPFRRSGLREDLTKEQVIEWYTEMFRKRFGGIEFVAIDFNEGFRRGMTINDNGFHLFYKETPETKPYMILNNGWVYPRDFLEKNIRNSRFQHSQPGTALRSFDFAQDSGRRS